jgi:Arc/MetJ-type ribon-helix-helix transcriptional regulator
VGLESVSGAGKVSLRRWLRRQLRQRDPLREHLEAAIEGDDPAEARRIVARFEFSEVQRHHVERLLDEWERDLRAPSNDLNPPRPA